MSLKTVSGQSPQRFIAWLKDKGEYEGWSKLFEQLKAEGYPSDKAWHQSALIFNWGEWKKSQPKRMTPERAKEKQAVAEDPSLFDTASSSHWEGKESTLRGDFAWVYDNLAVEDAVPEDCPSSGAWGLLQFARNDPKAFYVEWMRMVSRQEDRNETLERNVTDARRTVAEIEAQLQNLTAAYLREGAQDDQGEPEVPQDGILGGGERFGIAAGTS
jgi:hypothetical protein